jgi:hypothetical protein
MSFGERHVQWEWDTADGQTGTVLIDDVRYDPAAGGSVFLISTAGQVRVNEVQHDLSQLKSDSESLKALAREDPAVARFLAEAQRKNVPEEKGN